MGRYIDWQDLVQRYPDVAKAPGGDSDMSASWITHAEGYVEGRLASRYTVPFTPAPALVRDLVMDVTYTKINMRQKWIKPLMDDVEKRFMEIINGTLVLTDANGNVIDTDPGANDSWSSTLGYASAFGFDHEGNWHPSSNWSQDIQDER